MSNEWIENTSGVCPVEKGTLIDVMHRDEEEFSSVEALRHYSAQKDNWRIDDCAGDIFKWRLHKPELTLEDAWNEPDSVPWTETFTYNPPDKVMYKYPETKPVVTKKTIEQLAIDVLYNTTGKSYTEREIVAIVSIYNSIINLQD